MNLNDFIARFSRAVTSSGDSSSSRTQRPPQLSMHYATLTGVDNINGVADIQLNDPSQYVISGVRVATPYTATNTPSVGDVVIVHHYGTDITIVGQHVIPNTTVTP